MFKENLKRVNIGGLLERGFTEKTIFNHLKNIGATTCETYVKWIEIEPEPGDINFDKFDKNLSMLNKRNIKWQPFLICGPWYSTPYWYRESDESHFFKCLEHDKNSGIQSIWNKNFQKQIKRFLRLFHDHYEDRIDQIDSILLGVSGDYGEAVYPVIGNFDGQYHTHRGFWCNDELSIIDFQAHLKNKFKSIGNLNKRWNSNYSDFSKIRTFLKKDAPSPRAMVDMIYWYRDSMIKHSEFWIKEARKLWPEKDIYLCMGGGGSATEGQDYVKAAKMCAKYNVGIRDTNAREGFNFLNIYQCDTAVACKFYGTSCGFESSNGSDKKEIVARIFAFIIGKAKEFHEYSFIHKKDVVKKFLEHRKILEIDFERKADAAVFSSEAYINLVHEQATVWKIKSFPWGLPKAPHDLFCELRYYFDFDIVKDELIKDGILSNYKVLIIPSFTIIEDDILKIIQNRAASGGKVIVLGTGYPTTIDGQKIAFKNVTEIKTIKELPAYLNEMNIRAKQKKDGIYEASDRNGKILCYDEKKHSIYWL